MESRKEIGSPKEYVQCKTKRVDDLHRGLWLLQIVAAGIRAGKIFRLTQTGSVKDSYTFMVVTDAYNMRLHWSSLTAESFKKWPWSSDEPLKRRRLWVKILESSKSTVYKYMNNTRSRSHEIEEKACEDLSPHSSQSNYSFFPTMPIDSSNSLQDTDLGSGGGRVPLRRLETSSCGSSYCVSIQACMFAAMRHLPWRMHWRRMTPTSIVSVWDSGFVWASRD